MGLRNGIEEALKTIKDVPDNAPVTAGAMKGILATILEGSLIKNEPIKFDPEIVSLNHCVAQVIFEGSPSVSKDSKKYFVEQGLVSGDEKKMIQIASFTDFFSLIDFLKRYEEKSRQDREHYGKIS